MGRVIKKGDDEADVVSASLTDEDLAQESDRIPAEHVVSPRDTDDNRDDSSRTGVLRREDTQHVGRPVRIDSEQLQADTTDEQTDVTAEVREVDGEADSSTTEPEDDGPSDANDEEERFQKAVDEARKDGYEEGREAGYEAGYEEGYADAEEDLRAQYSERRDALIEDITEFENLWAQYIDESEPMLVDLAVRLAEVIVDAPLNDAARRASEEAIAEAVASLTDSPPVTVAVHPVDYQRLRESGLIEHLQQKYGEVRVESDPDRNEGDWSVSSPQGVIRRRRDEVIETLRDKLSLFYSKSVD